MASEAFLRRLMTICLMPSGEVLISGKSASALNTTSVAASLRKDDFTSCTMSETMLLTLVKSEVEKEAWAKVSSRLIIAEIRLISSEMIPSSLLILSSSATLSFSVVR